MIHTCPYCKTQSTDRVAAQLHFATCNRKPIMRKLSAEDYRKLLAFARSVDEKREAKANG